MIYTENIKKALNIMYNAHKEQKDKGNMPYVFHPYHIAEQMETEDEIIVALLHDVVEDTTTTIEDLKEYNFSKEVIEALQIITKDPNIDYFEYIKEIAKNKIARKVKITDLKHNSDITRINNPEEKDYQRIEKYKKALEILDNNN